MSTIRWNHVVGSMAVVVSIVAALPPDVADVVPAKYKPYVITVCGVALWIKSHWNLFMNPDGTPAQTNWDPKQK